MKNQNILKTYTKNVNNINPEIKQKMYLLYSKYYDASNEEVFYKDLSLKNDCIILENNNNIIGFSTIETYQCSLNNKKYNFIFSGDTIIEREYWGKNSLANKWLSFAGSIKRKQPDTPLYWFLIVKGHRTYRYLKVYSKKYFPHYENKTPDNIKKLLDHVATKKFNNSYNPKTGIISFAHSQGHLKKDIAKISPKYLNKPEVNFFTKMNPKYYLGDELACICELSDNNLQKISRYYFNQEV